MFQFLLLYRIIMASNIFPEIKTVSKIKTYYYSFKIFPQFWLAKSTRIIHHNQLLMTKFGRIFCLRGNEVKHAALYRLMHH